MTTDYHAFYLYHASLFFYASHPHDVDLTLFRNPCLWACVSMTHTFHGPHNPFLSAVPPLLQPCCTFQSPAGLRVVEVGLWSSPSCFGSVVTAKWRISSTKYDDDDGTPGYRLMHGLGTTHTQDPEQSLRRNISPLLTSVVRVHASPVSEALSCPPSFFEIVD